MTGIIDTRLANALFANARMSSNATDLIEAAGALGAEGAADGLESLESVLGVFADHYGGLWVGGRATLTASTLSFEPNALNRMVHEKGAELRMELPLAAVDSVTTRFGWFTGIIDVAVGGAVFTLRCYGSKTFAAEIEAARVAATKS
jgi:hypothetical protein